MASLDQIKKAGTYKLVRINADRALSSRMRDLGLHPGTTLEFVKKAPLGDPIEIKVNNNMLTIRKSEARYLEVE